MNISTGISTMLDINNGDYGKAAFGVATTVTGGIIGKKIDNLMDLGKLGLQDGTILKTGANLKLDLLNWTYDKAVDKHKQQ